MKGYQELQGKSTAATKLVQARLDSLLKFYVGSIPRPQWGLWLEDTFAGRILVLQSFACSHGGYRQTRLGEPQRVTPKYLSLTGGNSYKCTSSSPEQELHRQGRLLKLLFKSVDKPMNRPMLA